MIDTQQVRQSLLQDRAVVDAIRRRAHQISLERGYSTPQHMADDWFRAENEVLGKLIEEEIKRRQKMSAAISEGAMAEEAIPDVTLPPALARRLAAQSAPAPAKKSTTRRRKAVAETTAGDATLTLPPTTLTTELADDKVKRSRKAKSKSVTSIAEVPPASDTDAVRAAPAKDQATTKTSRKKTSQ